MKNGAKCLHVFFVLLAGGITQVFFMLCLNALQNRTITLPILIFGTTLNLLLAALDLCGYFLKKELLYKSCILLYLLLGFTAIVIFFLLKTGFFEIVRDEQSLEEYLARTGGFMSVLFVVLQFLQVVILPIPSAVTVVAGSALFGPFRGSLLSLTGIVIGSLAAFGIGRLAGYRVVEWLVGKETLEKWQKKVKGKDKILLSAMFLLPVFPDDVLCFVAGLSSMSVWLFLAVICVSRVLAIFTTSYSVTLIPFDTWWGILIWVVLIIAVAVLFVFLYKKSDQILGWFEKKFHRETRVEEKTRRGEFTVEVVGPDGTIVKKGVKKENPKK